MESRLTGSPQSAAAAAVLRATRWWPALAPPLAGLAWAGGPLAGSGLVLLALGACALGLAIGPLRTTAARLAAALLSAACLTLLAHLLTDAFAYRYVWLYSAAELPPWLKLANLWGGEEGTLLLLATLLAFAALRLVRWQGWTGPGALALAGSFALGALVWDPFAPAAAGQGGPAAGLGMNAHLLSPWMTLHPPLVFAAFALLLAPAGGALQALATGGGDWPARHGRWLRLGWLLLSLALVLGMWWAYEDFTFGQFWHWDPVQTAIFAVWALSGGALHGLARYQPAGRFARLQPLLGLLLGLGALLAMAVTRSPQLASSHRYVGDTSLPLLLLLAGALAAATSSALLRSLAWPLARSPRPNETTLLLILAQAGLALAALIGVWHIAGAYLAAAQGWPRPDSLKPFFETLTRWTTPGELGALRAAFAQWEPDRYALNAWLAPLLALLALAGGHYFSPLRGRAARLAGTAAVALAMALVALVLQPGRRLYTGQGMTSASTTAILPWLDALAVAALYLALAALLSVLRAQGGPLWRHRAPLALIHGGLMLALAGGTAATVFDRYTQTTLDLPARLGEPVRLADGFTVTVRLEAAGPVADGGRSTGPPGAFQALGTVAWQLEQDGRVVDGAAGQTVYRAGQALQPGTPGPVRLLCEILDYRYARYVSGDQQMIHPFIHRGLWQDVQVWLPAIDLAADGAPRAAARLPVVVKVYPLLAWLWLGLALALIGAAWRLLALDLPARRPPG
jgi:cytochrome c-type biogenesis protein CcmF